jgi:hypothetical protein
MPADLDSEGGNAFFPGYHDSIYQDKKNLFLPKKDPMVKLNKMIFSISPGISEYHRDLVKKELQNDGVLERIGSKEFYDALHKKVKAVEHTSPKVVERHLKRDINE